jgi:carboxypeptidase Taq
MGYTALLETMGRVNDVLNAKSVLAWDARTMMPAAGAAARARQLGTLAALARDLLLADGTRRLLDRAEAEVARLPPESVERGVCAQVRAAFDHHLRIPARLVTRRAELATLGQAVWETARAAADFPAFAPLLEEIVALDRATAEAIGCAGHPYDALMARFEPGETLASLRPLFAALRAAILPILDAVAARAAPRADFLARRYPAAAQLALARQLAARVGYDLGRGRLDTTVHPFEVSFTREDVRITTRADEIWLPMSLFGALHEAGHAIYEQGVDPAYTRTPFATDLVGLYAMGGASFATHESQSRLWENHLGRSRPFWQRHFPALRAAFPDQLADVDIEAFWRAVNRVAPGLIRTEADELTYDLHIMLRVELEAALIDGSIRVPDLPEAWNAAVKASLGLDVPDAARGLLQDVHWASAQIGYFGSYTVGNVMAAQLLEAARRDPAIASGLARAETAPLQAWMAEHVHRHGRRYRRDELLRRATGRGLDPRPYTAYLAAKYGELYDLAMPAKGLELPVARD